MSALESVRWHVGSQNLLKSSGINQMGVLDKGLVRCML